jgi:ferredoxin-NADP reductase
MAFHTITLQKVEDIADGTKYFCFSKPAGFQFTAGQYVAMRITNLVAPDTKNGVRSLSIASAPEEDHLGFGVRYSESGFKKTLWSMKPGDTVEVTDAVGFFTIPEHEEREIVFLIGGIGITPARSILKQATFENSQKKYTLFFSNRLPKDAPFRDELQSFELPHFKLIEVMSQCDGSDPNDVCDEHGYIRQEIVEKHVAAPQEAVYYLVGSPSFVEVMGDMLTTFGVPKENRHLDPFTGLVSAQK